MPWPEVAALSRLAGDCIVVVMNDLPPAAWYDDPENPDQYRYWDGKAWTDHRAPAFTSDTGSDYATRRRALIRPNQMLSAAFSLLSRRLRSCAFITAVGCAGALAGVVLFFMGAADLIAQLEAILDTILAPDFDSESPEGQAYLESITLTVSPSQVLTALAGAVLFAATAAWQMAAAARLALCDLTGRKCSAASALRWAARRLPRLVGVGLQMLGLLAAWLIIAGVFVALTALAVPAPAIAALPAVAAAAAVVLAAAVAHLAVVTASSGPARPSIKYALRLVKGAFWATLGRILLLIAVIEAVPLVLSLTAPSAGIEGWLFDMLLFAVIAPAVRTAESVGSAVLYHDLGGETA